MDGPGECFLARARFADDQDRQAIAGGLGGDGKRGAKYRRRSDQFFEGERGRKFFRQRRHFAGRAAPVAMNVKGFEQALAGNGLDEKVARPGAHGIDGKRDRSFIGQDDDRHVAARLAQIGDQRRSRVRIPLGNQHRADFTAVRAAQHIERCGFRCGRHQAPTGTRRRRRNGASFGRIAADQQHGS